MARYYTFAYNPSLLATIIMQEMLTLNVVLDATKKDLDVTRSKLGLLSADLDKACNEIEQL